MHVFIIEIKKCTKIQYINYMNVKLNKRFKKLIPQRIYDTRDWIYENTSFTRAYNVNSHYRPQVLNTN